jgi:flavin reductase (DIM6/NTAB) family NADH-FMN oxidoreductase RutF
MLDGHVLDTRVLRDTFGRFATGVCVITMRDDQGGATGVTVKSFASLSLDPALCLFSLGRSQKSCQWLDGEDCAFVVNILAADQEAVAWAFAKPREDKFEGIATEPAAHVDIPVISGAIARLECRLWRKYDGGDHDMIVGRVLHVEQTGGAPLLFFRGKMAALEA